MAQRAWEPDAATWARGGTAHRAVTDEGVMTENVNNWSAVTIIIVGRDDLGAPDPGTNGANGG